MSTAGEIKDINIVRSKRATRRGILTRFKNRFESLTHGHSLIKTPLGDLLDMLPLVKEAASLHADYQQQYDDICAGQEESSDRSAEVLNDDKTLQGHEELISRISNCIRRVQLYNRGMHLDEELSAMQELEFLSSPHLTSEVQSLKAKVSTYLSESVTYVDDDQLSPLRTRLQKAVQAINARFAEEEGAHMSSGAAPAVTTSTPIATVASVGRLHIELPKFSGRPTDWTDFHALFTAALNKRGTGLSDPERCCLLMNAMTTEEARRLVQYYQSGADSYASALRALIDAYGQPQLIYPHHVRALLEPDHYSYDRRSLRRMRETVEVNMRGMERVKGNTYQQLLAAIIMDRFDAQMTHEWTTHYADSTKLPGIDGLLTFFRKREFSLPDEPTADLTRSNKGSRSQSSHPKPKSHTVLKVGTNTTNYMCPVCSAEHSISRCSTFLGYDPSKRLQVAKEFKRCTNCLSANHVYNQCTSTFNCRKCNKRHHTLLHKDTVANTSLSSPEDSSNVPALIASHSRSLQDKPATAGLRPGLLNTAIVDVLNGPQSRRARVALDPGAAVSLMTESLASSLRLRRFPQRMEIDGLMGDGQSKCYVEAKLQSTHSGDFITCKFGVVPKIPCATPPRHPDFILQNPCLKDKSPLADPALGGRLDILVGALDVIQCLKGTPTYCKESAIAATPTVFGWTIVAPLDREQTKPILKVQVKEDPLHQSLQQLWELDKLPDSPAMSTEEVQALDHFNDTHGIRADGRYVVKLPRKQHPPELGQSRAMAARRFHQNERSLQNKSKLSQFREVLSEYTTLDHAEAVPLAEVSTIKPTYYLPVQGVCKESSTTTKLRAVFDASARTSTGVSLNDCLLAGPNLYPRLPDVLIRFRWHKIAFSADISKMFREIVLHDEERDLHRYLHRDSSGNIQDYRMKRLTFGVRSSPFIATRVIQHLAETHQDTHPIAAKTILSEFYVDDCLSGAATVAEAEAAHQELCNLLNTAGMKLRKWRSNSAEFRDAIPEDLLETADLQLPSPLASSKTLGMHWDVSQDNFHIAVPEAESRAVTKRLVASMSAKVYDVLGLFSPAVIPSKILLQELWKLQLNWDTPAPDDIAQRWSAWMSELPLIANHPVPRKLVKSDSPITFQALHGFADASQSAYGAAVYIRAVHQDTSVSTTLIFAKSRVAPLSTLSIPRLELVAAHLLSKLLVYISQLLGVNNSQVFAWTDSSIVLCWLQKSPASLKTFVAHRISAIQQTIPASQWRHVSSRDNPADLLSRGTSPSMLIHSSLWWKGPAWLSLPPAQWPKPHFTPPTSLPEIKVTVSIASTVAADNPLWKRYSSFNHLTRIIAWIQRFILNLQCSRPFRSLSSTLKPQEVRSARNLLLRLSQQEVFTAVSSGRALPKQHSLAKYDVSISPDKLLRVSGRVRQTEISNKPITLIPLSLKSDLTKLLISTLHCVHSHSGVSTLLCVIAGTYHIPGLKNFLKLVSRRCATCQKVYAKPLSQRMGMLPASRTTPSPPFSVTGIDFAGPLQIRQGHTRRPVILKAYACVFVCFVTKAVHLELCADLSTTEFMAALQRFCARRGVPSHIHTDNGSNFLGTRNEIRELQQLMTSSSTRQAISHFVTKSDIEWHFIPPRAPHFGGLWEAGVKAMKTLLRKMVGPQTLTFQELVTVLTEVEAILNSRPLTPLSSTDADEGLVLTAGHFLIGRPLKAPPIEESDDTRKISTLRRWNLVRRLQQDLWINWSSRYLQSLHVRNKWSRPTYNFKIGDVVILKDEMLKQRSWPLARVLQTYPGDDGLTRAVDLRCQGKTFRRSTHRLVLITEENQHDLPPRMSEHQPSNICRSRSRKPHP